MNPLEVFVYWLLFAVIAICVFLLVAGFADYVLRLVCMFYGHKAEEGIYGERSGHCTRCSEKIT